MTLSPPRWHRWAWLGTTTGALVLTLLTLLVGLAAKTPCLLPWPGGEQPVVCYNDLQTLWHSRSLGDHAFPYVDGGVLPPSADGSVGPVFTGHGLEYPVLTGLFVWLTSLPVDGHTGFLLVSAAALTPFALVSAWLLHRLVGRRALLFAATPPLVWYGFLNWDLLVVAATVAALYAWRRERTTQAAVWLAVGACLKLFPLFLLAPLVVDLVLRGRRGDAVRAVLAAGATALAVNLPFALTHLEGWLAPFAFQGYRSVDLSTNSLWYWLLPGVGVGLVDVLSWTAVLTSFALVLGLAVRWTRTTGAAFPLVQVSGAMTVLFVLLGKVHSPQYALWVLPFLVLLAVPTRWVVAFLVTDVWLYAQWAWITDQRGLMASAVAASVLVLAGLVVVLLKAPLVGPPRRADPVAQPAGGGLTAAWSP